MRISSLATARRLRRAGRALILIARTVHDQPARRHLRSSAARRSTELDARARDIFRRIVETYLETGEPVGSRTISRAGVASVAGLDPQHHAGPGPAGPAGRAAHQRRADADPRGPAPVRRRPAGGRRPRRGASGATSRRASPPAAARLRGGAERGERDPLGPGRRRRRGGDARSRDAGVKHVEFVALGPDQALAIMVFDDGPVENRLMRRAGRRDARRRCRRRRTSSTPGCAGRTLAEAERRDARRAGAARAASSTPPPRGWSRRAWPPGAAARGPTAP